MRSRLSKLLTTSYYPVVFLELMVLAVLIYRALPILSSNDAHITTTLSAENLVANLDFSIKTYGGSNVSLPKIPIGFMYYDSNPDPLKPGFEQIFEGFQVRLDRGTHVKINSDGFRDSDYPIEKQNGTYRIIVLGNSLIFGWGLELNETVPKLLEKYLNNGSKRRYEVMNFGVPGQNTENEVELLRIKGLKYRPDMVIIGYSANDLKNTTKIRNQIVRMKEELPSDDVIRRDIYMVEVAYRSEDEKIREMPLSLIWSRIQGPLDELDELAKENNFQVVIVTVDYHTPEDQVDRLSNVCGGRDWCLINMNPTFIKYDYNGLILDSGDPHYNPLGDEILSKEVYARLRGGFCLGNESIDEVK